MKRKSIAYLTTLDNSKLSIANYFFFISPEFSIDSSLTSGSRICSILLERVFPRYRKSQFFPNTIPRVREIATISVQRQEMIHFRPVEESERTMDQFVFRTSLLPSYLSLHRFSAASNVSTPSLLFYYRGGPC